MIGSSLFRESRELLWQEPLSTYNESFAKYLTLFS
jgi:hypothetical protein